MIKINKDTNIGILYGGWSNEREISLESGEVVFKTLKDAGYSVFLCDLKNNQDDLINFVHKNSIGIVFNLIHGTGGEDGTVQSWLDDIGVNYVGSDTKSSKVSFSKIMTKLKWLDNGLKTPDYIGNIIEHENLNLIFSGTNKYVLKPDKSGSSVGIKILNNSKELSMSLSSVNYHNEYFVEEYAEGYEYTAPIIGDIVFPIIKIETKREFYDYQAKYIDDDTSFTFPIFEPDMLEKIESTCLKAFQVLGCKGWGRVDFFIDNNEISLIEVNTIPGMTSHSLVPMSAKKKGYTYLQLVELLLNS
jgi:D-alanine-D-alanine ligase|tara:strand:+ start:369 stop:1277 length:909 start_codon:yes stop_codon:yes gene_type:complete